MVDLDEKIEVFCSYAHEDEKLLNELKAHLSNLPLTIWHDRRILAGREWAKEINAHLNTARIILFLVSPNFLASEYCDLEVRYALERHNTGEACVIPIFLRAAYWKHAPFSHIQGLPEDAKPIPAKQSTRRDAAFSKIAEGIHKIVLELKKTSMNLVRPPAAAIWNLPYQRNPFFIGREEQLARLEAVLQSEKSMDSYRSVAISGLGGIGKTQIAIEYVYRHAIDYRFILWASAESQDTLMASFVEIANVLKLPTQDALNQHVTVEAVKRWLQVNTDWLLILDNADELKLVNAFFPTFGAGRRCLLLTTRAQASGSLDPDPIKVDTLTPEMGARFLLRRAKLPLPDEALALATSNQEAQQALAISRALDGLPLALDQAGAYIEETQCHISGYLKDYMNHSAEILNIRGELEQNHPETVATTWLLSFSKVEQTNPLAAEILRLCAFLAPDAIPEQMILEGAAMLGLAFNEGRIDAFVLNKSIKVLLTYSLVRRLLDKGELAIHRLVQVVLIDTMKKEQLFTQWTQRVARFLNQVFPRRPEFTNWPLCERYLPHVLEYARLVRDDEDTLPDVAEVLRRAGWYLGERGNYNKAETLLVRALALQKRISGPEAVLTARAIMALAWLFKKQGKYEAAEAFYQTALQIFTQNLGAEHSDTIRSLNGLATLYEDQGRYENAETLYRQVLSLQKQQLGLEHIDTASGLNNLAGLFVHQKKYGEAEALYQQALSIRRHHLEPEHPDIARSLNNLAGLFMHQKKYGEAEALYQQALSIQEKQLGIEHPDMAIGYTNLGLLYERQRQFAEAEQLYLRALSIREQQLRPEHPDRARSLGNLIRIYKRQDLDTEAQAFAQRLYSVQG